MENNALAGLEKMITGLKQAEKDLSKMGANMGADLGINLEKIMKEHTYEGDKKMKVMGKKTTVSLAKDGSWKVVFDDVKEGIKIFKGEK